VSVFDPSIDRLSEQHGEIDPLWSLVEIRVAQLRVSDARAGSGVDDPGPRLAVVPASVLVAQDAIAGIANGRIGLILRVSVIFTILRLRLLWCSDPLGIKPNDERRRLDQLGLGLLVIRIVVGGGAILGGVGGV
jgi:hypothetical protein